MQSIVLAVVILLTTCLIKYLLNISEKTCYIHTNVKMVVKKVIQTKSGITVNVDVSVKILKNVICAIKYYLWNPTTCNCENGQYAASIYHVWWNYIFEKIVPTKAVPTKSISKNFYILLVFLLVTMVLLMTVSIYCYLIRHRLKKIPIYNHTRHN